MPRTTNPRPAAPAATNDPTAAAVIAATAPAAPAESAPAATQSAPTAVFMGHSTVTAPAAPAAPKVDKAAALAAAVQSNDVAATVVALAAYGKGAAGAFSLLVDAQSAAAQNGSFDPAQWDMPRLSAVAKYRSEVESAWAAAHPAKAAAEPTDPTIPLVMGTVRAMIAAERTRRDLVAALAAGGDTMTARAESFLREHAVTDLAAATAEQLDAVFGAARGGKRVAKRDGSGADRKPADTTPQNGAGGWARGDYVTHIKEAMAAAAATGFSWVKKDGSTESIPAGTTAVTLYQLERFRSSVYPDRIGSAGALRNIFMRGVEGFVASNDGTESAPVWVLRSA